MALNWIHSIFWMYVYACNFVYQTFLFEARPIDFSKCWTGCDKIFERIEGKAINHSAKTVPHHKNIIDLFCICINMYGILHVPLLLMLLLLLKAFTSLQSLCWTSRILPLHFAIRMQISCIHSFTHFDLFVCLGINFGVILSSVSNMFHTPEY